MDEASTEPLTGDQSDKVEGSKAAIAGDSLTIDPEMVDVSKIPLAGEGHAIDSEMVDVSKEPLAAEGLNMESNVAPYWCTSPGGSIARFNREEDAIKYLKQMTGVDEDLLGMGDVGPDILETQNLLGDNGIIFNNLGNLYGFPDDQFPEENGGFFNPNQPIPTVDNLVTQRSPLTSKTVSSPAPTPSQSVPVETANSSKESQPQEPSLVGKIKPPKSKNKPYDTETAKQKKKKLKKKKQQNKKGVPDGQNKPRGPKKNTGGRPTLKETTEKMELQLAAKKAVIQALKDAAEPIPVGENKKASSNEEESLNDDRDTNDQEDLNKDVIKEKPIEALNDKGESEDNDDDAVQIVFEEDSSQQLLIICKAFTYENLDDMEVHFGLRFGIDKVGRSAIRTLFIVKSMEKDFAEEAMEKLNSRNYKDKPMKSMLYKNSKNSMYKLPKICIFTERKKNKKNK